MTTLQDILREEGHLAPPSLQTVMDEYNADSNKTVPSNTSSAPDSSNSNVRADATVDSSQGQDRSSSDRVASEQFYVTPRGEYYVLQDGKRWFRHNKHSGEREQVDNQIGQALYAAVDIGRLKPAESAGADHVKEADPQFINAMKLAFGDSLKAAGLAENDAEVDATVANLAGFYKSVDDALIGLPSVLLTAAEEQSGVDLTPDIERMAVENPDAFSHGNILGTVAALTSTVSTLPNLAREGMEGLGSMLRNFQQRARFNKNRKVLDKVRNERVDKLPPGTERATDSVMYRIFGDKLPDGKSINETFDQMSDKQRIEFIDNMQWNQIKEMGEAKGAFGTGSKSEFALSRADAASALTKEQKLKLFKDFQAKNSKNFSEIDEAYNEIKVFNQKTWNDRARLTDESERFVDAKEQLGKLQSEEAKELVNPFFANVGNRAVDPDLIQHAPPITLEWGKFAPRFANVFGKLSEFEQKAMIRLVVHAVPDLSENALEATIGYSVAKENAEQQGMSEELAQSYALWYSIKRFGAATVADVAKYIAPNWSKAIGTVEGLHKLEEAVWVATGGETSLGKAAIDLASKGETDNVGLRHQQVEGDAPGFIEKVGLGYKYFWDQAQGMGSDPSRNRSTGGFNDGGLLEDVMMIIEIEPVGGMLDEPTSLKGYKTGAKRRKANKRMEELQGGLLG